MDWIYDITGHSMYKAESAEPELFTAECYCGQPPRVNDAKAVALKDEGPLPPGLYIISKAITHPMLGPVAMSLSPFTSNEMYGRGGFWIHGDSLSRPGFASLGCIIMCDHDERLDFAGAVARGKALLKVVSVCIAEGT